MRGFMLTLTMLLCIAVPSEGATYYVDASRGDDSNPGTSASPWRTLGRAKIVSSGSPRVAYGDTVILMNGNYGSFAMDEANHGSKVATFQGDFTTPLPDATQWVTYRAASGQTQVRFSTISMKFGSPSKILAHAFDGIRITEPSTKCVLLQNVVGIRFSNMTFIGELDLDKLWAEKSNYSTILFKQQCNDIKLDHCDISGGYRGIDSSGNTNNFAITNSEIHNIGVDKIIYGTGTNILIEGNRIHGQPRMPGEHPDCIQFYTAADRHGPGNKAVNVTIRGNQMYNHSSQCLWVGGSIFENWVLENNLIYNMGNYELRLYGVRSGIIRNNTIIGNNSGQTGVIIYGGTFPDGELEGLPYNEDVVVANNIFACPYWGTPGVMSYHDHNIFYKSGDGPGNNEAHSRSYSSKEAVAAALFRNPSANDYRLKDGSPAIDFGTTATGIHPTDLLGVPREGAPDAGCFEWGTGSDNHVPSLNQIGDRQAVAGETLTLSISGSDADGDPLTYSASGLPSGATFSDRTFTWTPTAAQAGSHQVTFEVTDGQFYDSETITITVDGSSEPSNRQPNLGAIGNKSINENERLSFSISATDPDGDTITYSASGLPNGASLSGQNFAWTPNYGQAGVYQITFVASDGESEDSEKITVTVVNVNRAPTLASVGDRSVNESSSLAFSVSATDPDGDAITYSATGLPSGANLTGNSFNWTPTLQQIGSHEVTFVASDGASQDSETITVYVVGSGPDHTAPTIARLNPEPDSIQVVLNNLVTLHVTDSGMGVDASSVVIRVDGEIIFQGDVGLYTSGTGRCHRSGSWNDYRFIYQPNNPFGFDHEVRVTVDAADRAGNAMSRYAYSFATEMRAFGSNWKVNGHSGATDPQSHPTTVGDANGNIWAAWHAGAEGTRQIHVAALAAGATAFAPSVPLTISETDHCNPDMALAGDGRLYIVWQDKRRGNWDVFLSTSTDGATWSRPIQVTNSNFNETHPAIAVERQSPYRAYVVWQDDRNGAADIYVASSTTVFADSTVTQVTASDTDQLNPDVAVDGENVACIVWTDMRSGQADIYGATSDSPAWANVPVVTTPSDQTDPSLAAEAGTSVLHLVWTDDAAGDSDIYYALSDGLPASPVTGSTIIDDTSGAEQLAPSIVCLDGASVFACWQDLRNASRGGVDTDLYLTELGSGAVKTNILIGDDRSNADQSEPVLGIDGYGNPYVVWTDGRNAQTEIYYAATTFIDPNPLDSKLVVASQGATVGPDPATINGPEDVSIIVPAGACQCDVRITISEILNPLAMPAECLGSYDFGPSGIDFDEPVTVTIPYRFSGSGSSAKPYWYDSLTGALSQQGITDIKNIVIASDLNALQFKTTHFTPFYLMATDSGSSDGGGSGGGCSVSATGKGSPKELLVPYGVIALVMVALRRRDRKRIRSFGITRG